MDIKKPWLWGALFLLLFQGVLAQGSGDARLGGMKAQSALSGPLYADASYLGTHNGERVGFVLSRLGDVNGDGLADFAIGSPHSNPSDPETTKRDAGAVYLILGKPRADLAYNVSLENANAIFWGKNVFDAMGSDISDQGDINGDGYDDILIGASGGSAPQNPGHAFIVFGKAAADWGKNFILEDQADASFYGEAYSHLAGQSVSIVGDINADGYDDFLVSAPKACDLGQDRGRVYLFKGKASGWQRNIALAQADAIFHGIEQDGQAGYCAKGVGDVNGDGVPDFAIGAKETPANGRVYLFFGNRQFNWGTNFQLDDADVIFTGEETYSYGIAGGRIAAAGNLNNDSYDDFLISDFRYDQFRGKVYVIFGKTTSGWTDISLSQSNASFLGENRGDGAGLGLGSNFDCNNDGLSDIVVGAPNNTVNGDYSGIAYLIKGKQDDWQNNISLLLNDGYRYGPSADQQMGFAVNGIGDFNGDGGGDFVFSATYNDDGGFRDYGKVFLFLGEKAYETVKGSVTYITDLPVAGVTLNDNGVPQTTTDATAEYSLQLKAGQDHTVTPTKSKGEDVGTSVVSSWDAVLAARHSVGLGNLDSQQRQSADVDDDGRVTMYDAVHIARYAVGITAGGSRVGNWVFDPESREYLDFHDFQTDQDYTAMIVGDVDANWSPSMPLAMSQQGVLDSPQWESSSAMEGNLLRVTLSLTDRISLISFDAELEYDAEVFEFTGFEKGEMAEDFQVFSSAQEGSVRLGGFRVDPLDEEGTLLVLTFTHRDQAAESGHVSLTRIQLNERLTKETVTLYDSGQGVMVSDFTLYDNYPNPFNGRTTLKFDLQQEDRVRIVVYDRMGRLVREIVNQTLGPGRYRRTWDGTSQNGESVASGVYIVTASTSRSIKSKKVIFVK